MDKMEERAHATRRDEDDEEKEKSLHGPFLLFDFLIKMLEKDFDIWWKGKFLSFFVHN